VNQLVSGKDARFAAIPAKLVPLRSVQTMEANEKAAAH
jgi:hypothetical protein